MKGETKEINKKKYTKTMNNKKFTIMDRNSRN
jgi:hypothetical protein